MRVAAKTDIGRVRDVNEDSYCAFDLSPLWAGRIFAVADGMGGYDGGEVASSLAIMTLHDHLRQALEQWKAQTNGDAAAVGAAPAALVAPREPDLEQMLADAFAAADAAIQEESRQRPDLKRMGTTLTAVLAGGGRLWLAHAGDSRAYLMSGGVLRQISEDHSLVGEMVKNGTLTEAEAMVHPQRNIMTNALGTGADTHVDLSVLPYSPGDRLVLCTDGLTGAVSSAEMAGILSGRDPAEAAEALVSLANERGGHDNITVLVVELS
ncbi:MAG: Stp1/IreP family PP2C-type Ser/Thr phosphatase [Bacillota bacterium]